MPEIFLFLIKWLAGGLKTYKNRDFDADVFFSSKHCRIFQVNNVRQNHVEIILHSKVSQGRLNTSLKVTFRISHSKCS